MKNKFKKLLTISTTIIIIVIFSFFYINLYSKNIINKVYGSSLVSSNTVDPTTSLTLDGQISNDIAFLTNLIAIKNIKLDIGLFTSKSFISLKDNSIKIGQAVPGRKNPFNPIGNDGVIFYPDVVTDEPTNITDKTVIFNGKINTTTNVTDLYFEYGIIENSLSMISQNAERTIYDTFSKNITGLISKTKYFYKACAKINNLPVCGEVVSFNTN